MTGRPIPERIRQRLIAQAIAKVAAENGNDRLTTEDMYSKGRTAIVHLHVDDYYAVSGHVDGEIETKLNKLLELTDRFLEVATGTCDPRWLAHIRKAADRLRPAFLMDKADPINRIGIDDIKVMIAVVNETIRQHVAAGYETTGIIDPKAFLLAQMVADNFDAYEMTLNQA